MAEEVEFENRHFCNFKSHVTLTLTSDDLESHIVVNVSSTSNIYGWTYIRTDIFTGFIRSSLRR